MAQSPADQTIADVARIEHTAYQARSRIDHLAAAIMRGAGTGTALIVHGLWFLLWILGNTVVDGFGHFDPFPFSLLTSIVSLEAIFLTLFVLITQNRMSREADRRAQLDLQVNLLAEKEATMILRILHEISGKLGIAGEVSNDLQELLKETKLEEISEKLEGALPSD